MGKVVLAVDSAADGLIKKIESESGTSVSLCYQCGKCTAGCPVAFAMDYGPRQVIRLLQLGLAEEALHAGSVWICATCETCSSRCPRGVDIAGLMDAVRREAQRRGIFTDREVAAFNRTFLGSVKRFGRLHETGLVLENNLRSGHLFRDAEFGMPMMLRGKIKVLPERIKGHKQVKEIFARVREMEGEKK